MRNFREIWAWFKPVWDKAGFYMMIGASLTLILGAAIFARTAIAPGESPSVETDLQADFVERLGAVSTAEPTLAPAKAPYVSFAPEPPIFKMPLIGGLVGPYAYPYPMYWPTLSQWGTHEGIDIAALSGSAVYAAKEGDVTEVYTDPLFGHTVVIAHADGLITKYSGLSGLNLAKAGDAVSVGDVIGAVGSSAIAESNLGSHLHFEVWQDGVSMEPEKYFVN